MRRMPKGQAGVAMVTVLFVGATLTVVTSASAFLAVRELRSSLGERRSADVLAVAESGIDRFLIDVKAGALNWGEIRAAGCPDPVTITGQIDAGRSFTARLTIYDPTQPAATRTGGNASAPPCTLRSSRPPRLPSEACPTSTSSCFAITSTGTITGPGGEVTAKRVVREIVSIGASGLPIGMSAGSISGGGTPDAENISIITSGDVTSRDKIDFSGNDAFYRKSDFYSGSPADPIPAAAHAAGTVYVGNASEHPPDANCSGTVDAITGAREYAWDGSGKGDVNTLACPGGNAPTSKFTLADVNRIIPQPALSEQDFLNLKATAKRDGLYCGPTLSACTKNGAPYSLTGSIRDADIAGLPSQFVAYFDFSAPYSSGNSVNWDAKVNLAPTLCPAGQDYKEVTLVVRNGDLALTSGAQVTGFVVVPEGTVKLGGNYSVHGTILAKTILLQGTGSVALSECWVSNFPGAQLEATRQRFGELDR